MKTHSDLSEARILIVNDDGFGADGIRVLEQIALSLTENVYVVAPAVQQSGMGHAFTIHRPLIVKKHDDRHFAVDGTPTDCVLFGCRRLLQDTPPDLILSGINFGANFGADISYSGTVGAAMEGTLQGIRSVACSLHVTDFTKPALWETPKKYGAEVLKKLYAADWADNTLMNVNFPDIPAAKVTGTKIVPLGYCKIGNTLHVQKNYFDVPFFWIDPTRETDPNETDTDICEVCTCRTIAVSPVTMNWTDTATLNALKNVF